MVLKIYSALGVIKITKPATTENQPNVDSLYNSEFWITNVAAAPKYPKIRSMNTTTSANDFLKPGLTPPKRINECVKSIVAKNINGAKSNMWNKSLVMCDT